MDCTCWNDRGVRATSLSLRVLTVAVSGGSAGTFGQSEDSANRAARASMVWHWKSQVRGMGCSTSRNARSRDSTAPACSELPPSCAPAQVRCHQQEARCCHYTSSKHSIKEQLARTSGTLYLEKVAQHADWFGQVKRLHPCGVHRLLQTVPGRHKHSGTDTLTAGQRLAGDLQRAALSS